MKGKRIAKEKREEEKKGESQRALLRPFFSLHFSFTAVFCPFHTAHRLIDRGVQGREEKERPSHVVGKGTIIT